jgi:hypothetical protein
LDEEETIQFGTDHRVSLAKIAICPQIKQMSWVFSFRRSLCKHGFMQRLLSILSVLASRFFLSRRDLLLENLAPRQQLAVLKYGARSRGLPLPTNYSG